MTPSPLTVLHLEPWSGETLTIGDLLDRGVERLRDAHRDGHPAAAHLLRGTRVASGPGDELTLEAARRAIARDRGFADWEAAAARAGEPLSRDYEAAADAVATGDLQALGALLDRDPSLVRSRSAFSHHATLLHLVAANGIEFSRQWRSPGNAVEIARALLERGAEPDALCDTYGGGRAQTTLCLLVSSAPPAEAGTQAGLVAELCRAGARPDGLDDDGLPLWTAIAFGYSAAAEALARAGARVDNPMFAAALGDLAALRGYVHPDGTLRPGPARSAERIGASGKALDPERALEYALIYAAAHGRVEVVELLLGMRPDLDVTEPLFHSTALGAARYHGRADVIELLEAASAAQ